jgi:hypothetical protein
MTLQARWLSLVLALIVAFGGGLAVALLLIERNERDAQRDLCDMLAVFIAPTPPPETERGRAQYDALAAYRAKRC